MGGDLDLVIYIVLGNTTFFVDRDPVHLAQNSIQIYQMSPFFAGSISPSDRSIACLVKREQNAPALALPPLHFVQWP